MAKTKRWASIREASKTVTIPEKDIEEMVKQNTIEWQKTGNIIEVAIIREVTTNPDGKQTTKNSLSPKTPAP